MHAGSRSIFRPRLIAPRLVAVGALLAGAAVVHFRGRVKLRFGRQLTDHSTFTAPYNSLVYLFSKVPNRPFLDTADFPGLRLLQDNWRVFRDEGLALMDQGRVRAATGPNDVGFHTFFRRGWKRFYLKWYDDPPPSALELCPRSVALLAAVPEVKGAMFALLPPGGKLGRHRDPFAGCLRYHLGLSTPGHDDCWIEVDGERRSWRDGEAMIFDETYVHEARNGRDTPRLILFCDVERPLAFPLSAVNRAVMSGVMRATRAPNIEGEPIGAINRLYGRIAGVLEAGKRLKARDRRTYYLLKNAVLAAAAALILQPWP
jgi:beta-hydroxylase